MKVNRQILTMALAVASLSAAAGSVKLAEDGKALAEIVIADKATKAAQFGAQDLKWHLDKITGGDFRIVKAGEAGGLLPIYVGESAKTRTKAAALQGQEFVMDIREDAIELVGLDRADFGKCTLRIDDEKGVTGSGWPGLYEDVSTLYAVYEFLEFQVGAKWLDSTDYGTVLPKKPTLAVRTTRKQAMPFEKYRGGTQDWAYRPLLWKRGDPQYAAYHKIAYRNGDKNANRLFITRHRGGGIQGEANHSFYHWYDLYWNKDSKFFKAYRPELFAQGYVGKPPQLCYSNPETVRLAIEEARNYFDHDSFEGVYARNVRTTLGSRTKRWGNDRCCLEPMDNGSFCKCPACQALLKKGVSEYWFTFVDKVARALKESHPDKYVSTLAYGSHEDVPTVVTLPDNVIVYFCISGNRTCWSSLLDEQLGRMDEWHRKYPNMVLAMWLYNTFPLEIAQGGGFRCFPGFFAHEAVKQYRFFKDVNARGGVFHCGFNGEVENYMQYELMFDPMREADDMLDEYFSMYGAAKEPMRRFYDIVERRYCDKSLYPPKSCHQTVHVAWGKLGTPDVMAKLGACMDEAERLASTPEEKARVALWKIGVWEYMKDGFESFQFRQRAPKPSYDAPRIASAGGDPDKVDWAKLSAERRRQFDNGSTNSVPYDMTFKCAHDGKFLYCEYVQWYETAKLVNGAMIAPYDETEIMFALQEAQPYRCWFLAPDGRQKAASWGEVNWRQGVSADESGHKNYDAVYRSDTTAPDRWTIRLAIPLDQLAAMPVAPGSTLYMNATTVTGSHFNTTGGRFGIHTVTACTSVHTPDRMAKITLGK